MRNVDGTWIRHAFELLVLLHVLLDLLLNERTRLLRLLLGVELLRILLLSHLDVVVQLNLLHHHEVVPVYLLSHLTVLSIQTSIILAFFKPLHPLLIVKVSLAVLSCSATLHDASCPVSVGLMALQSLALRLNHAAVGLNQGGEV